LALAGALLIFGTVPADGAESGATGIREPIHPGLARAFRRGARRVSRSGTGLLAVPLN